MGYPATKRDKVYTYGDYIDWPGNERWEIIDGIAWNMSPAPSRYHQAILNELLFIINSFIRETRCHVYPAPFDVLLPDTPGQDESAITTVVQPDISVICDASKLTDKGCVGPPDWIIEIISPHTSHKDFLEKLKLYEQHGVREYWIVDPENKYVNVYNRLDDDAYPQEPLIVLRNDTANSTVLQGSNSKFGAQGGERQRGV